MRRSSQASRARLPIFRPRFRRACLVSTPEPGARRSAAAAPIATPIPSPARNVTVGRRLAWGGAVRGLEAPLVRGRAEEAREGVLVAVAPGAYAIGSLRSGSW